MRPEKEMTSLASTTSGGAPFSRPDPQSLDRQNIKSRIHKRLLESMDLTEARKMPPQQLQDECTRRVNILLNELRCPFSTQEKTQLIREVLDEIFGLGPLEELLRDLSISDILVNGSDKIYIERHGRLEQTDARFRDDDHLIQVIQRIASNVGRRIDESSPMLDARLEDGSRVNAIIAPLSLDGPAVSIRRFGAEPINAETLVELNAMTSEMALFLEACVAARLNIVISGGTGAGKTTLLNSLSRWIPGGDRVVTIEDAAELQLQREHVVRLETRPSNIEGEGRVTQRDLLKNALRMRPDRIIIGEVRGAEAMDMLQAMNTGHDGSMTTVHANNARDATRRIENMVSMAGFNFPIPVIRQQMGSAINILVHVSRMTGGRRKVASISEITGMEGDQFALQDIFVFSQKGMCDAGHAQGRFEACGVRPSQLDRIKAEGIDLPVDLFQRRALSK